METIRTVCFTGHRHIPEYDAEDLYEELLREIERQIHAGAKIFRAGGALGFDTLAARAVLTLRRKYRDIRLELILPCPSQADNWKERDIRVYREILAAADDVKYVSSCYFNGVLQLRNQRLVEGADVCIAYLTVSHGGGAAYTSALAVRSGLEFINLADAIG